MSTRRFPDAQTEDGHRRYTLDEMIDVFCRSLIDASGRGTLFGCGENCRHHLYPYPFWERVRIRVADLIPQYTGRFPKYLTRREMWSRIPPVILTPVESPRHNEQKGLDLFPKTHGWHIQMSGDHQVRVAQAVGDEWIDAFVPCEDEL